MKTIKVYTTSGSSATIETNVSTVGELKPLLSSNNINYDGMQMVVGETKNELSRDDASLPEGDFKLFIMPKKTKSGNSSRLAELYATIADCYAEIAALQSNAVGVEVVSTTTQSAEDAANFAELRAMQEGQDW